MSSDMYHAFSVLTTLFQCNFFMYPGLQPVQKQCHHSYSSYCLPRFELGGDHPSEGGNQQLDLRKEKNSLPQVHGIFCHVSWPILSLHLSALFCCTLFHAFKILTKCSLPYFCSCQVMHQFFVTWDHATSDGVNHHVCIVFKTNWDPCMFHECTWGRKIVLNAACL